MQPWKQTQATLRHNSVLGYIPASFFSGEEESDIAWG